MKEIIPIYELFDQPDEDPTETELSKAVAELLSESFEYGKDDKFKDEE